MSRGVKHDVVVKQGSRFELTFRLYDVVPSTTITPTEVIENPGVLTDLTGLSFRSQFRREFNSPQPEAVANVVPELIPHPETGENELWVVLEIPTALTTLMTAQAGVYDVEMVDGQGEATEVLYGAYTLALEATK